jgi:hypothetical protein
VTAAARAHDQMWSGLPAEQLEAATVALRALFVHSRPSTRSSIRT